MANTSDSSKKTGKNSLFRRACRVIPGGVNSPVRAFKAVGGNPVFISSGKGAMLTDTDGRQYIDFCGSWGPLILGHAHPAVVAAIKKAALSGSSFGTCTAGEVELAELLCRQIPHIDRVRLVSSGTEACMTALRLARAATNRSLIVKFDGCYHGHSDALLVSAGSGLLTSGIASSAGVSSEVARNTYVLPYNDQKSLETLFRKRGDQIAAVIIEPVAANMGLVAANPHFLLKLRELTSKHGAILIFDEVVTGFRFAPTTFGTIIKIKPDLTCLGKIIGGGMPIGAVAGRAELMDLLAPSGPVYQAGTLSGNPVAVAAGLATLQTLIDCNPYEKIAKTAQTLFEGVDNILTTTGQNAHIAMLKGVFTIYFTAHQPVKNLADAKQSDTKRFAAFFNHMLKHGFYLPPSQFEVAFISAAHTSSHIEAFLDTARKFFNKSTRKKCI